MDTELVDRAVYLFARLRLPTEGWPGWVYLGGWLHTEMVTRL